MNIKCLKDEEIGLSNENRIKLKSNYLIKILYVTDSKEFKKNLSNIYNFISIYKHKSGMYFSKTNLQSKDTLRDKME